MDENEDIVEQNDHDSTSEQEVEQEENESECFLQSDGKHDESGEYYIGKDKNTKWRKKCSNKQVRLRSHNIIRHFPGPKREARNATSEIECIKLFVSDAVIRILVTSTNTYIEEIKYKFDRDRDARKTDETEIKALIGIMFLIGILRSSRKNAHKIWDNSKGNGVESCYLAMSETRFRFLIRCLRFDDIRTRKERKEFDKLAPIREVFEIFLANFQNNFIPSEFVTVDEQLLAFRGRCPFKQYIPNKPAKYGIKTFALVDAKTSYTLNLETYVGTQPDGPYKLSNSAEDIVLRLVHPVGGTNRNITGDNWFSSIPLTNKLLQKRLTYVGTLRKNKREIPVEFLPNKRKEENSSVFGFQENITMVSFCPKKNKSVILVSSMHHDDAIDLESGDKRKPEIVTFYNHTKIGVDLVDQLCQKYNVARNTRRWPMVVFYNLLNIAGINALCIFKANHPMEKNVRSDFIEKFAWELIKPQIVARSNVTSLPTELRRRARSLLGLEATLPPPPLPMQENHVRRCNICPRSRNKSTRKVCVKCKRHACKQHAVDICTECLDG